MRLTDAAIASLKIPDDKAEIIVFDSDLSGFGIRVRRGGSKRFIYQYKLIQLATESFGRDGRH